MVLDAVPFATALDYVRSVPPEASVLASLRGPVPLVSSFPSSTSIALTALFARFGLELPPGYENKYFDRAAGRVRGGTLGSYGKIRFDWHHFFDWQLRGFLRKSKAYARPLRYNVLEVDRALEAFAASDEPAFFVYVNSTDATGHAKGPAALRKTFENLDARLAELEARLAAPFHVVLLSDHGLGGGTKLRNVRGDVVQALERSGWRVRHRLEAPRSVVLTPFGLVSSFEVYTHPGREAETAAVLARVAGVDLCASRDGDGRWIVTDRHGRALITSLPDGPWPDGPILGRPARRWSYHAETGDPLDYAPVVERLQRAGADGPFAEALLFSETVEERYPDALFRLATAFELVQNPASILCSVADGHLYGSKSAGFGARFSVGRLEWTHGALTRDASLGFLMTDYPGWTPAGAVRFDTALDFVADHLTENSPE
jgi:hypothetical protein